MWASRGTSSFIQASDIKHPYQIAARMVCASFVRSATMQNLKSAHVSSVPLLIDICRPDDHARDHSQLCLWACVSLRCVLPGFQCRQPVLSTAYSQRLLRGTAIRTSDAWHACGAGQFRGTMSKASPRRRAHAHAARFPYHTVSSASSNPFVAILMEVRCFKAHTCDFGVLTNCAYCWL